MPSFTPPTFSIRHRVEGALNYGLDYGMSVVRVGGTLSTVQSPTTEQLIAAGDEGVDWFLGGHEYQVSVATATELTAAGYAVIG